MKQKVRFGKEKFRYGNGEYYFRVTEATLELELPTERYNNRDVKNTTFLGTLGLDRGPYSIYAIDTLDDDGYLFTDFVAICEEENGIL